VAIAAIVVVAPQLLPIGFGKIAFGEGRPGDIMAAVVVREVQAIGLVVGGEKSRRNAWVLLRQDAT